MNASLPAQLTTTATSLRGVCALTANVDASHGGSLAVEVLDSRGYRLRGFDRDAAVPIVGVDSVGAAVAWRDKALKDLPAEVSFRCHLRGNVSLFALNLLAC